MTRTATWENEERNMEAARLARCGGVYLTPYTIKTNDVRLLWTKEDAEFYEHWYAWYAKR